MRFLLDENLPERAAALLRERGYDAITVRECGRQGLSDEEQLSFAAQRGRVFVSHDYDDMTPLTKRFEAEQRPHAGVLMVPPSIHGGDFAGLAGAIERFAREHPAEMAAYEYAWLLPARR